MTRGTLLPLRTATTAAIVQELQPLCCAPAGHILAIDEGQRLLTPGRARSARDLANSTVCHLYRLPFGINYALKLLHASGTSERLVARIRVRALRRESAELEMSMRRNWYSAAYRPRQSLAVSALVST